MSISVVYEGGTFNQWTQYAYARVMAEQQRRALFTGWPHGEFIKAAPHRPGKDYEGVSVALTGFHQNADWIFENRMRIKEFSTVPEVQPMPPGDVVVNIRHGDYQHWRRIPWEWYQGILDNMEFGHLHIVGLAEESFKERFLRYQVQGRRVNYVRGQSAVEDWNFIRRFNNIITANGTYSFWAAFFSAAERVWVHDPFFSARGSRGEVGDKTVTLHKYPGWIKVPGLFDVQCPVLGEG